MAITCIICGNSAGSQEHVFPAALGGRRTNKKIYCKTHNECFSHYVVELEKQLAMFNAILKVRPDRHDAPKPYRFVDKDGSNFSMVGQNIQTAAPPLIADLGLKSGEKVRLKFADMEQWHQWRLDQRQNGWDAQLVGSQTNEEHHFGTPLQIQLKFGGQKALKAIGYLSLTFFAQYFPNEARQVSLKPFKDFLMDDQQELTQERVWWDGRDAEQVVDKNPFKFGHTVVVGISRTANRAYAYISLFSSLNFGIDLGSVWNASEGMVQVFIDPTADKARDSINEVHSNTFSIDIDPALSDFAEKIRSGSIQAAVTRLLNKVSEWHFDLFIEEIECELNKWANIQPTDPCCFAEVLTEKNSQRVLNLLSEASSGLKTHLLCENLPQQIFELLDRFVEPDDSQPNGLSLLTNALHALAKAEIIKALKNELGKQEPNPEHIALLLGGGKGVALVMKNILLPILQSGLSDS